jgi:hypothetical protein
LSLINVKCVHHYRETSTSESTRQRYLEKVDNKKKRDSPHHTLYCKSEKAPS